MGHCYEFQYWLTNQDLEYSYMSLIMEFKPLMDQCLDQADSPQEPHRFSMSICYDDEHSEVALLMHSPMTDCLLSLWSAYKLMIKVHKSLLPGQLSEITLVSEQGLWLWVYAWQDWVLIAYTLLLQLWFFSVVMETVQPLRLFELIEIWAQAERIVIKVRIFNDFTSDWWAQVWAIK